MSVEAVFFYNLSLRLRKENNLSDITWAICNSSDYFMNKFLSYCFGEDINTSDLELLEREYPREDCRPDFHFMHNAQEYIIEVKIYNRDYHFEKYEKAFPDAKKAFIANYTLSSQDAPQDGWKISTWKEFFLKELKDADWSKNEDNVLLSGYREYLKSVINLVEVKTMNLTNISSLGHFYNVLNEIREECDIFPLKENTASSKAIDRDKYGKNLCYTNKKNNTVHFWYGLYIFDPDIDVYFLMDKSKCPKEEVDIIESLNNGKYFDQTNSQYDPLLWVPMKKKYFKKLCVEGNVEEQKELLKGFLNEILGKLK